MLFCYSWTDVWNTDQELDSLWGALTGAQGALEPQYLSGKDRGVQGLQCHASYGTRLSKTKNKQLGILILFCLIQQNWNPRSEDHSVSEGIFALDFYGEKYKTYMWGDLQLQLFCNQGVSVNHKMFIPVFG